MINRNFLSYTRSLFVIPILLLCVVKCEEGRSGSGPVDGNYPIFRTGKGFQQDRFHSETGELEMRILGEQQNISAKMDKVTWYNFKAFFYNKDDDGKPQRTQLTAKIGELNTRKNDFTARGNVVVKREGDSIIKTEVAIYNDKNSTMKTPADVWVQIFYSDGSRCQGYGLKSFMPGNKNDKLELDFPHCDVLEEKKWREGDL